MKINESHISLLPKEIHLTPDETISKDDTFYLEKTFIRHQEDLVIIHKLAKKYMYLAIEQTNSGNKAEAKDNALRAAHFNKLLHLHSDGTISTEKDMDILKGLLKQKVPINCIIPPAKFNFLLLVLTVCLIFIPRILSEAESPIDDSYLYTDSTTSKETILKKGEEFSNEVPLNITRTALYNYVKRNRFFPSNLNVLVDSYPNNYLSTLPMEQTSLSNHIHTRFNNTGGWVYIPPTSIGSMKNDAELRTVIENSLFPNSQNRFKDCPFEPLHINISKRSRTLEVKMGQKELKKYPIGLGSQDSTPIGQFAIEKKVALPNYDLSSSDHPFGTRGMQLSNHSHAIHGTNEESSIGKNISKGCIRLYNSDIEELFSVVPIGTNVVISNDKNKAFGNNVNMHNTNSLKSNKNKLSLFSTKNPNLNFIFKTPNSNNLNKEKDGNTIYRWKH